MLQSTTPSPPDDDTPEDDSGADSDESGLNDGNDVTTFRPVDDTQRTGGDIGSLCFMTLEC